MVVFSPQRAPGAQCPLGHGQLRSSEQGIGRPIGQAFIVRPGQAELRSFCVPPVDCSPLELGFLGQACAGPRLNITPVEAVP